MSTYNRDQLNRILHGWRVINLLPPASFFSIFFLLLCFDVYFMTCRTCQTWVITSFFSMSYFLKNLYLSNFLKMLYFHLIFWLIFLLRKRSLFITKMHLQKTLIIGLKLQINQIPLICFDRGRRVNVFWVCLWCFLQYCVILRGKKRIWFDLIKIRSILNILEKKWKCA